VSRSLLRTNVQKKKKNKTLHSQIRSQHFSGNDKLRPAIRRGKQMRKHTYLCTAVPAIHGLPALGAEDARLFIAPL
jgi:hypothetical protein